MGMRLHEVHPSTIHAPLALLPTAAVTDFLAALRDDKPLDRMGRTLWWVGTAGGLFAGLAGMAASREVRIDRKEVDDAMWLHGIGNLALVISAAGIALWRSRNRASVGVAALGLTASAAAVYTAYLGGELVYGSGVGIKELSAELKEEANSPKVLSAEAPTRFASDALRGAAWLFKRTYEIVTGRYVLSLSALRGTRANGSGRLAQMPVTARRNVRELRH